MKHSTYLEEIFTPHLIVESYRNNMPKRITSLRNVVYIGTVLRGNAATFIPKQTKLINRNGIVRKKATKHSKYKVEMSHDVDSHTCRWIFVDDIIDTGQTFRRVMEEFNPKKLMGCLLYHDDSWLSGEYMLKTHTTCTKRRLA